VCLSRPTRRYAGGWVPAYGVVVLLCVGLLALGTNWALGLEL